MIVNGPLKHLPIARCTACGASHDPKEERGFHCFFCGTLLCTSCYVEHNDSAHRLYRKVPGPRKP